MPETGQSWQRAFLAEAEQARVARRWISARTSHPDAHQIAGELFIAVLATRPGKVLMTLSTAGARARITASGDRPLPLHSLHGPGRSIIRGLAEHHGTAPDDCGLWAELPWEKP
ncbi:hypothetical protein ACIOC1_00475 [Streptomyces sp. NPDC088197]|uniref:hypothetical protein n=1 Tax=Streptomyces sp. NPDC088197 TaxID=3365840 RepID=UPI0038273318